MEFTINLIPVMYWLYIAIAVVFSLVVAVAGHDVVDGVFESVVFVSLIFTVAALWPILLALFVLCWPIGRVFGYLRQQKIHKEYLNHMAQERASWVIKVGNGTFDPWWFEGGGTKNPWWNPWGDEPEWRKSGKE